MAYLEKISIKNQASPVNVVSSALLMLAVLICLSITYKLENDYYNQHLFIANHAVQSASIKLEDELKIKHWQTQRFLVKNSELINRIVENPSDVNLYNEVNTMLKRYIPDVIAFNVSNLNGEFVIDNFDGAIGEFCKWDMAQYISTGVNLIRIHPNPVHYHYDVFDRFEYKGKELILLVSFDASALSKNLLASQPSGHQLSVVDKNNNYLIEMVSSGMRNILTERHDFHLNNNEVNRILSEKKIDASSWYVVDSYDANLFDQFNKSARLFGGALFFFLMIAVMVSWRILTLHASRLNHVERQLVIKNKKLECLNAELKQSSDIDGLTGLFNHRYFKENSNLKWNIACRTKQCITIIMIDIDEFKAFNDVYGHLSGDNCLRQVAAVMSTVYNRSVDILARYGGEEFSIITIGIDYQQSLKHVEKLRACIENEKINIMGSDKTANVTISAGLISIQPTKHMKDVDGLQIADDALYEAKRSGKNRIVSYDLVS